MSRFILLVSLLLVSVGVMALDLKTAKDKGLVGETTSGYLASPVGAPGGDVKALMADINGKRKEKYQEIAKKLGQPATVVEKMAGQKAINKTTVGHYVQNAEGKWQKK